jgi:hypothetical protein
MIESHCRVILGKHSAFLKAIKDSATNTNALCIVTNDSRLAQLSVVFKAGLPCHFNAFVLVTKQWERGKRYERTLPPFCADQTV